MFSSKTVVIDVLHAFLRFTDAIQNTFLESIIIQHRLEDKLIAICQKLHINWRPNSYDKKTKFQEWTSLQGILIEFKSINFY
jgi:hypothetical protein